MNKGFTLIELIVVVTIIVILSSIIMFSVSRYVNEGKDSNIASNLAVLIPAGEVFYGGNGNSYATFCALTNDVFKNTVSETPDQISSAPCYGAVVPKKAVCCYVNDLGSAWVACARKFSNPAKAYCADSRGMKKEIDLTECIALVSPALSRECP